MPMLDAYIPEGALAPEAEERLLSELTDLLLLHEGADPADPRVRSIAWVFLHRPAAVYVAGTPTREPHYKFVASVPEGQFDDERREAIVEAITAAVLRAEAGAHAPDPGRVWVFGLEVPDGTWGAQGRINRLVDIVAFASGDPDRARQYAERRLASRRRPAAVSEPV